MEMSHKSVMLERESLASIPSNIPAKGRVLGIRNLELLLSTCGSCSQKQEPCCRADIVLLKRLLGWDEQEGPGKMQLNFWVAALSKRCSDGARISTEKLLDTILMAT